jgi:hypothetical protein
VDRRAVLAIATGALVAVLFAVVATSGSVRYVDGPPRFFEQLDDVQSATEVRSESIATDGTVERPTDATQLSPLVEMALRIVLWTLIAVAAALASAALWRRRPSFAWHRRQRTEQPFDLLADVAATITADAAKQRAALQTGAPRDAIVACWLRLEASVIAAGVVRRPSDTSTELVERVLAGHQVNPHSLAALAGLYREARFSDHEMTEAARATAIAELDQVHAGLARSVRSMT